MHLIPRAIEWVDDVTPALLPAVRQLGLPVLLAPLMVLDASALPAAAASDADGLGGAVSLLDPDAATFADDLAVSSAVYVLRSSPRGELRGWTLAAAWVALLLSLPGILLIAAVVVGLGYDVRGLFG